MRPSKPRPTTYKEKKMADKQISDLSGASEVTPASLFVIEQNGEAKKLTGLTLIAWMTAYADGHGGIQSITKTGSTGTDPVVDEYRINYSDGTYNTFTITNGLKGDPGPEGPPLTIDSYSVDYAASASGTVVPSEWQGTVPSVTGGNYLWTRTTVVYGDGTNVVSYSVARSGIDGLGSVSSVAGVSPDGSGNVPLTPSNIGAASLVGGKVDPGEASSAIGSYSASFTLSLSDAGKLIKLTNSSAITITIPEDSDVDFPVGTEIEFLQTDGGVTFGGSVTILSLDSTTSIAGVNGVACLKKLASDQWLLAGALK